MVAPKLKYDIELDTKKAQAEAKGFSSSLGGVKGALAGIGAFFAVDQIVDWGKQFVNFAASAEELQSRFDIVFGTMKEEVEVWAKTLSEAVGRSSLELKRFAADVGTVLTPLGFEDGALEQMSTTLAQLAVDVASFQDRHDPEVLNAFTAALNGEREMLKTISLYFNQEDLNGHLEQYGINVKEITGEEKKRAVALASLNILVEKSNKMHGDAERTYDSLQNTLKRINGELTDFGAELAEGVTPALANIAISITKIGDAFGDSGDGLGAKLGRFIKILHGVTVVLMDAQKKIILYPVAIAKWVSELLTKIPLVGGAFEKVLGILGDVGGKIGEKLNEVAGEFEKISDEQGKVTKGAQAMIDKEKEYVKERLKAGEISLAQYEQQIEYWDKHGAKIHEAKDNTKAVYDETSKWADEMLRGLASTKSATASTKQAKDATKELAKAQEEAARAAEKWAETVKEAEQSVLNTYKTVNDLAKEQLDIRKTMAQRIAEELMDTESELTDAQIRQIQAKFGVTEAEISKARQYLSLTDLEKDLIRSQQRINKIEEEKKQALREQVAALKEVLQARMQELGISQQQLNTEQLINQTINQRGGGGGGGGGGTPPTTTQPGDGGGGVPPTSPNQNRSSNNINTGTDLTDNYQSPITTPTQPTEPTTPPKDWSKHPGVTRGTIQPLDERRPGTGDMKNTGVWNYSVIDTGGTPSEGNIRQHLMYSNQVLDFTQMVDGAPTDVTTEVTKEYMRQLYKSKGWVIPDILAAPGT